MIGDTEARRRYRIAMVAAKPFPVPQGSQVLVRQTAELLAARSHEVHLVVYGYGQGALPTGVRVHRAANFPGARKTLAGPSWAKPFQDAAMVRTLQDLLRHYTVDIVHAHNYEGLLVALCAGARPIVYHAHTCMRDELPYFVPPAFVSRRIGALLDAAAPRCADRVIALHDRARDDLLARGCRPDDVAVIPPGIDTDMILPIAVGDALPTIVYAGNLDAYQNLELLGRAMAVVRAKEPRARLHVATADPRPCPMADARIETPDRDTLRHVLAGDVIVVCPRVSWSGYPIKLVNAMAAGKPIVACAGAAYGLVDRETALIVADDDVEAFAAAVLDLLADAALRMRLGASAQRAALANHSPGAIAAKLEAVYGGALAVRR